MTSESLPILLSTLALGAAGVALAMVSMQPTPVAPVDIGALEAVQAEQARLRKELSRLRSEIPEIPMVAPEPARQSERQELPLRTVQLTSQVEALVARVARLEQQPARTGILIPGTPPVALTPAQRQQKISELQAKAMDGTQLDVLRIVALQRLRSLGKGARCGTVARSMIDLAQGTQDPKIRADVWRNMHRADDKRLIDPMIQALAHDTDRRTREEAAESLGFFLDVPRVKAALEQARSNDADEKVRAEAGRSLAGRNR